MRESITISIRPTYPFTCAPAVFNLFLTDHHQRDTTLSEFDHVSAVLAAEMLISWCTPAARVLYFQFSVTNKCSVCLHLVLFLFFASKGSACLEGGRSMRCCIHLTIGRRRLWNISDSPLYSWRQRIDALNAGCRGLVSSLYSRQLTYPHYITIRLSLKVILPEHNHTQSKPQTSSITETVNSPGV